MYLLVRMRLIVFFYSMRSAAGQLHINLHSCAFHYFDFSHMRITCNSIVYSTVHIGVNKETKVHSLLYNPNNIDASSAVVFKNIKVRRKMLHYTLGIGQKTWQLYDKHARIWVNSTNSMFLSKSGNIFIIPSTRTPLYTYVNVVWKIVAKTYALE